MAGRLALFSLAAALAACGPTGPGAGPDGGDSDGGGDGGDGAPDTEITSGPTGDVAAGAQLAYAFTSATAAAFECRVDAEAFADCTSPHTVVALDGPHTFEVRARDADGDVDPSPAAREYRGLGGAARVRLVAGNLTSGNNQAYEAPGTRIFQGLRPDIALVQELNVGDNTPAAVRAWVTTAFGAEFTFFREAGAQIPNAVVSRYPIVASGVWEDAQSPNREFAYARIDVPGPKDLWAVSVHFLTDGSRRPAEATALVGYINAMVPPGDYLVIGGDLNSSSRTEAAINTLGQVVDVGAPFPADQAGDADTNANRNSPYDWVMLDPELRARQVPVTIGAASFPAGLVFDSRVYTPLADVPPVQAGDSGATNMQHMGVVKDVLLPGE